MQKNPKLIIALALIPQIIFINILAQFPEVVERYYSNGIYQWFSAMSRFVFGWLPFSFGDIFYAVAIIFIIRWLIFNRKRIYKDFKNWLIDVFSTISLIYFAFHVFWAFNYYRLPLHKNLNLKADYSTEELITVTQQLIKKSNALHLKVATHDTLKVNLPYSKRDILSMAPLGYEELKNVHV